MNRPDKTNRELMEEISSLKEEIRKLKKSEADCVRAREELRQSEEKYRILLSESPDPTFSFTPEGQYKYVNRAFALGVGKPVEEIIGRTIWDVFPKEEADKRFAPLCQVFRTGVQKVIEVRVPRADSDRYYVTTITPVKDAKDNVLSVICSSKEITERKRMEAELRDSEELHRILFEYSGTAVIIIEDDMTISLANQEFAHRTGYTREEIEKRKKWTEFVEEEDLPRMIEQHRFRRESPEKGLMSYEFRFKLKSGEIHDALLNITLIPGTRKSIASLIDIHDRKQAEEALKKSEDRFRRLAENAQDLIYRMSLPDGKYEYVSPASAVLTGYAPEEYYRNPLLVRDIIHPDFEGYLAAQWEKLLTGDMPDTYEYKAIHRSGEERWFFQRNALIRDNHGKPIAIEGIVTDITQRKQMEEKCRDNEARFRAQYQGNPVPTFTWRKTQDTFILEEYNSAALALTKGGVVKFVNRTAREMYADRPDILDDMHRSYAEKGVVQREIVTEHFKPGKNVIATYAFVPPDLVIAYLEDITERKRAEEEKNRLQERLQRVEKMEALGTLAGGVAHDLNNVLGILVGYSELLLVNIPAESPMRNHVEKMMQGGVRAAAIVNDLLTLARRGVHTENVVNLNSIISDCQKTPEFENLRASHPRIRIQIDLAGDLLNMKGSASHVSKTFMNLLINAVEAMPKGGALIVATQNRYLDRPIQGYDDVREGDYITLSVSDTGEGIADKDLKHIFEPFYTKKIMGRSGTGLGLAVVWGTVKDHKGYIDVRSEEGKGTTVILYFPVTREAMSASPAALPLSDYLGQDELILVVDDIQEQRELASMMLGNLNYRVTTAASGEEAVEYLRTHRVDLIVLDMIMDPGMDGLDTYQRILEIHPGQKAVIVSGFSESDRVQAAQALGAGAYVRKPYIMEKLGMTIRKELDRSAQKRE